MKRALGAMAVLVLILGLSGCSLSPRATVDKFISAWQSSNTTALADVFGDTCVEYMEVSPDSWYGPDSYTRQEEVDYYGNLSGDWTGLERVSFAISDEEALEDTATFSGILTLHYSDGSSTQQAFSVGLLKSPEGKWEIRELRFGYEETV